MEKPSLQLIKHTVIYGISDVLNRILAFILIPIYTRFLTTSEYGILQIFVICANVGLTIVQLGISSAIFKSVLYHDNSDKEEILNTAFYFIVISSITLLTPMIFIAKQISQWIFASSQYVVYFKLIVITIFFRSFSIIPLAKLRIENSSLKFSVLISSNFIIQLLMNIFFVIILKKGMIGILISECIVAGLFAIIYTFSLINILAIRFSFRELNELLGFGMPLVPAALAMFVLTMSDRFFLKHFSSLEDVGLYSIGYRFGMIIGIIVTAFQKAWPSVMFTIAKKKNAINIYKTNFTNFLLILFTACLGLSLFGKNILMLLTTPEYISGYRIIPFISLSFLCYGIYFYTAIGMNLKKKTIYQPVIVGMAAVLNLILNWLLIPRWNIIGASLSTFISFCIMALLANIISLHFYYIPYQYKKISLIIAVYLMTLTPSLLISFDKISVEIIFKFLLFAFYFILLGIFGFFNKFLLNIRDLKRMI